MLNVKGGYLLSRLTTLQIGGPAKYFVEVKSDEELIEAVKFAKKKNIPFLVIGNGSNLLVSDEGFPGLVIKNQISGISTSKMGLNTFDVKVKAGTPLQELVDFTINNGLGGMNKMTGIPGTLGGAVYGDAGAYGHSIRDFLTEVVSLNPQSLEVVKFDRKQCEFGYRETIFKRNKFILLEVKFSKFPKDDYQRMMIESKEVLEKRTYKYPPNTKCPGSFFKNVVAKELDKDSLEKVKDFLNPYGKIPAGALIETVGGKGDRLGQIKIAQNHGNTFINLGAGNAKDFYNLAKKYFKLVKEKFAVELEPEVQLINLPPLD